MDVYLDLVMGLNFLVDFFLLLGTNRLSGFPPGCIRSGAAAALGGIYAGACMLPGLHYLGGWFWRVLCLCAMGLIAFGLDRSALRRCGIFLLLAMAMGGVAIGLGRSSGGTLLTAGGIVWLLCTLCFREGIGGRSFLPVRIRWRDKSVSVTALVDTGSSLRDPLTGERVMVIGPDEARTLTGLSREQLAAPVETAAAAYVPGLRLVPFRSVGQSGGMLLAMRFAVTVENRTQRTLVAFAPEKVGSADTFQALIGGGL